MNSKTISVLAVIIVVSMAIIFLSGREQETVDPLLGTAVFQDLRNTLSDVNQIEIVTRESELKLALFENVWVVKNRGDYPARFDKLSDLLDDLSQANYAEKKTSKPEFFDRLGLLDLDHEDSKVVKVKIMATAEEPLELLVGSAATNRKGQYFRFPGEQQTWMMSVELDVEIDAQDWLKPTIINIDSKRVGKVTQTSALGKQLTVVHEGDEEEDFDVMDLPMGKKLKYGTIANELGRSLVNVRLKDVIKADGFDFSGGGKAEYWCKDGLVVTVLTKERDGQYFLRFQVDEAMVSADAGVVSADADQVSDESGLSEAATESEESSGSDQESDQVSLAEEIDKLHNDLDPWVFEVTQFTFDDFSKTLDDLVEEEKEPEDSSDG